MNAASLAVGAVVSALVIAGALAVSAIVESVNRLRDRRFCLSILQPVDPKRARLFAGGTVVDVATIILCIASFIGGAAAVAALLVAIG